MKKQPVSKRKQKLPKLNSKLLRPIVALVAVIIIGIMVVLTAHNSAAAALPNVSRKLNEDRHGYTTVAFTVKSNHWGYKWNYDCTNAGSTAPVVMEVEDTNGSPDSANALVSVTVPDSNKYPVESGVEQAVKAGTFKIMVGTACAWRIQVLSSAGATTSTLPSHTGLEATQSSTSSSTNTAPQPKVLLDLSGNGDQQTQPFTTTGSWTLAYTYDCSAFGSQGNFIADINNTDGSTNTDTGVNELGTSGGTTDYYYDAGQHYLSINSECSWHVTVKGD